MIAAETFHAPIALLWLCCQDGCDEIGTDPRSCPACGNGSLRSLSAILNREEPSAEKERSA